jgi:diguanylate cyclase (GGDEF)-like protein
MDDLLVLTALSMPEENQSIQSILSSHSVEVKIAENRKALEKILEEKVSAVVILDLFLQDEEGKPFCTILRKRYPENPVQLVLVADNPDQVSNCLEMGADDFVFRPLRDLEFSTRIQAALIRLRAQREIYVERDFFRTAVYHEEKLSNTVLDQHLHLKEAFSNIEKINRDLEQSNRKLERIARFDMLSGLLNRMTLFHTMDMEIERAVRNGTMLSGVMIDLDYFKMINDNHGHQAGDEAIRVTGKLLLEEMRRYDQAGRYGGEEFFVVLPDTSVQQAMGIAERYRQSLAEMEVRYDDHLLEVTASFGVAPFHPGESREHWIGRADRAMYRAKQGGRNRVEMID